LGVRINIDFFRGLVAVVHLKVAFRFFWLGASRRSTSKVLFFRQHFIVSKFIRNIIGDSRAFLVNRWPGGIIGNWHTKVRVPLMNYQSTAFYKLSKSEHNRYFKLFSGFMCLLGKPDLVIFLEYPGLIALKDCWLNGVPTISVVDSNSNSSHVTYVIPGNHRGTAQCVILSMFLELLVFSVLIIGKVGLVLALKLNFWRFWFDPSLILLVVYSTLYSVLTWLPDCCNVANIVS
jgi:ribosomal protein S2